MSDRIVPQSPEAEPRGQFLFNNVIPFPEQIDPTEFLDGRPLSEDPAQAEFPLVEVYGRVRVGLGSTYYKAYFSEDAGPGLALAISGYSGFFKSSEPFAKAMARYGKLNTVIYDPIRLYNLNPVEDVVNPQRAHVLTQNTIYRDLSQNVKIKRKAPGGLAAVKQPLTVITHSMGNLSGPEFAAQHADNVELFISLHGVVKGTEILKAMLNAVKNDGLKWSLENELKPFLQGDDIDMNRKNVLRLLRYHGIGWPHQTRMTRTLGEMVSCVAADARPSLRKLGKLSIPTVYVHAEKDILVHPGDDIADYVSKVIYVPNRGHLMPQAQAQEAALLVKDIRDDILSPKELLLAD